MKTEEKYRPGRCIKMALIAMELEGISMRGLVHIGFTSKIIWTSRISQRTLMS